MNSNSLRKLPSGLLLAGLAWMALGLCGCESGGGGSGGVRGGPAGTGGARVGEIVQGDAVGQQPDGVRGQGLIQIKAVDRSKLKSAGTVEYEVTNISGRQLQDLTYRVQFVWPPSDELSDFDSEVSDPGSLVLFEGASKKIEAASTDFASRGDGLLTTNLYVEVDAPVAFVQGTRFVHGGLECTGLAGEEPLYEDPPSYWVDLKNVSERILSRLMIQLTFVDTRGNISGQTKWESLPRLKNDETFRKEFDLSEAGTVRGRRLLLRIKQSSGI